MFEIALEIYILKKRDLNISKTLNLGKKEARGGTPSLSSVTRKTELLLCFTICTAGAGEFRLANLGLLVTGDLISHAC